MMINTISFICSLVLFSLASTASAYTITGSSCVQENALLNEVPTSAIPSCSTTFLLPPSLSVINNLGTALGLPVVERSVLVAHAGLALNDSNTFLDLGSSTNSVRLAAAVQSRGFNLYYGPFITLTATTTPVPSESATRQQFLPRGPDFNITLTDLTNLPPSGFFNHTYVEYFPGAIRGSGVSYNVQTMELNFFQRPAACTVTLDNQPENCFFGGGYHGPETIMVTQQETPLVPATC